MNRLVVCGLQPAALRSESASEDALLQRDAHNFADWYRHVALERPDLVPAFNSALAEVIDGFRSLRLERVGQDARALMMTFDEHGTGYELRFDEVSDGHRALIVLYGLTHLSEAQECTLLLDEPDNYVGLSEIQPWLIKLADACGESVRQAIPCSHHPDLIDYLGGESGLVLRGEASGVVTARRLDQDRLEGGIKLSEQVARGWAG